MFTNTIASNSVLLIVDDEPDITEILVDCATRAHVRAIGVTSIAEANRIVNNFPVAAMSLDFKIPEEDGISFFARMRKLGKDVPAVMITGNADAYTAERALAIGIQEVIYKPFNIKDISARYKKLMSQNP